RWQRFRLDAELTALVLEARAEKTASRDGEWPKGLANLESSICPGRWYSYRKAGGIQVSFEGPAPPNEPRGLVLPFSFRGPPPPPPTGAPSRMPPPTPTPVP